ncbi:hypothetical protein AGMMS50212_03890 [Spirochaetia bacterium]|nr:hypothetical protein AGMMS50212_03890 [Spirochaetia bacterium]
MSFNNGIKLSLCFFCVFVTASCAVVQSSSETQIPQNFPQERPAENAVPYQEDDSIKISDLPKEVREYLVTVSAAFKKPDIDFLISQGEENYEKELRGRMVEEQYLALLYRAGPYSKDSPWKIPPFMLDPQKVKSVEWINAYERGPVYEIEGKVQMKDGKNDPCRLVLLWKLKNPKIVGAYP